MKDIKFKKLKIKNFLSFGEEAFTFDITEGINFITGYNYDDDSYNGVGKTTLAIESLSFLLFGNTYRSIKQDKLVNRNSKKTVVVEGFFSVNDDEYRVMRSASPSKLLLEKNGEDITSTIKETNKKIVDVLSIDKDVFMNMIVMSNRNNIPFLQKSLSDKVSFIEGVMNLGMFADIFEEAKDNLKEQNKQVLVHSSIKKEKERDVKNIADDIVNFDRNKQSRIEFLKKEIENLKNVQPKDNTTELEQISKNKEELVSIIEDKDSKISKAEIAKSSIESDLRNKKAELVKYNKNLSVCPTCKRPMEGHDPSEIENEKEIIKKSIDELEVKYKLYYDRINAAKKEQDERRKTLNELKQKERVLLSEQTAFDEAKHRISIKENELKLKEEEQNPYTERFQKVKDELVKVEEELKNSENEVFILEKVKEIASPAGIKTVYIKQIIGLLNDRFNYYLRKLNAPCKCVFNEYFEETFYDKNGSEIEYGSFSGGEAVRVDFSMLFAFRDIRRILSNVKINISVFDELFDSSLDISGVENIMRILSETAEENKESYYIITHRFNPEIVGDKNVIFLEKRNNTTTIRKNN